MKRWDLLKKYIKQDIKYRSQHLKTAKRTNNWEEIVSNVVGLEVLDEIQCEMDVIETVSEEELA